MVRGKTKLRLIENRTSRHVTFAKRKNGLLKKARELSELCGAEVVVIVYSQRGKLSVYSSKSLRETIQRYRSFKKGNGNNKPAKEDILQRLKEEIANLSQRIEILEETKCKLSCDDLDGYQVDELHELETEIEKRLHSIGLAKSQLTQDEIKNLQNKNNMLTKESGELHEKLLPLNKDTEGSNIEINCVNPAPSGCFEVQGLDAASSGYHHPCNLPHKEYCFLPLNQRLTLPTPNRLINDNIDANPAHCGLRDNIKATVSRRFIEAQAYQLQLLEPGSGFQNNSVLQEDLLPLNQRPVLSASTPNILINNNIDGNTPAPSGLDDNINANPAPDIVHLVPDLNLGLPGQGGNKL